MNIVLSSLFAILTGIGAFIAIPIGPVPITMQTLFTYLAGGILGSKWGALSQVIYVILGLIGIPFFCWRQSWDRSISWTNWRLFNWVCGGCLCDGMVD